MSLHRRARSLIRVGVIPFAAMVVFWGCGGGSGPPVPTCDIPQLFIEKCGSEACHGSSSPSGDLDLVSPGLAERMASVPAATCTGPVLADPSDPLGSFLYTKVADAMPECGARMPYAQEPLSDEEITCIRDWISGLPPPNPDEPDANPGCAGCECVPETVESCYNGPGDTSGIGICQAGMRECVPSGLTWVWGPCEGEVIPRGEDCTTDNVDENCDGSTPPCGPNWSMGFGTDRSQSMRSVAIDSGGNVIALGDFQDTLSFGGDPLTSTADNSDIVLVKYDQYGTHQWSKRFGDSSNQYATQVTVDAGDNIIIIGRAFGTIDFGGTVLDGVGTDDIFVAKFDRDGNHIWSRIFGGLDPDRAERVTTDADGDVIVTGTFTGTVDFGSGPFVSAGLRDAFVLKLGGASGVHLFSLQIGGTGDDYGFGVGTDAQNDIFITGRFHNTINIGGDMHTSAGGSDIYVAKLDPVGNYEWSRRYGSAADDVAFDLAVDPNSGEFAITGHVSGNIDFGGGVRSHAGSRDIFLARFDNEGDHVFSQLYGDADDQFEVEAIADTNVWSAMAMDAAGNMYLAGPLAYSANFGGPTLSAAGKSDSYFVKLSPTGSYLFGNRYGGVGTEFALDVAVASSGEVAITGRFFGSSFDFGVAGTIAGRGGSDGFLAQFGL